LILYSGISEKLNVSEVIERFAGILQKNKCSGAGANISVYVKN
jgi:hypothetical protein